MLLSPGDVLNESERILLTRGTGYLPYGQPDLRAAIAWMLTTFHGIPTTADQVLITTGAMQALDLLLRCEVAPGHAVVTEDPTYPGFIDALHRSGARPVGVPPGDMGRLASAVALHRPALVYLIPTYQNPTGLVLPAAERHEVVALAERHPDITFIDDMTTAELPLSADGSGAEGVMDGPPPLAALAPRLPNVVTVGSLSKTYWGGLRIGWVRAPEGIIARLAAAKAATDLGSPAVRPGSRRGADPLVARADHRLPGRLGQAAVRRLGGRPRRAPARLDLVGAGRRADHLGPPPRRRRLRRVHPGGAAARHRGRARPAPFGLRRALAVAPAGLHPSAGRPRHGGQGPRQRLTRAF